MKDFVLICNCGGEVYGSFESQDKADEHGAELFCADCKATGQFISVEYCSDCCNTGKVYVKEEDGGYTDVCTSCDKEFGNGSEE